MITYVCVMRECADGHFILREERNAWMEIENPCEYVAVRLWPCYNNGEESNGEFTSLNTRHYLVEWPIETSKRKTNVVSMKACFNLFMSGAHPIPSTGNNPQ